MEYRLDAELVRRGLYTSRSKAAESIKNGGVVVNGKISTKPSLLVSGDSKISATAERYVSRAAKKLEFALKAFKIDVKNAVALDVGASTGGFSQILLENGAKKVYAIDVGTNQLSDQIKNNPKVVNMQQTNFLDVERPLIEQADVIVSDLSFVSLTKMSKKFAIASCPIIVLIKPQFECGKEYAHKHKGVVKDKTVQLQCIKNVVNSFEQEGLRLAALDISPILGGDGNKEFVALFRKNVESIPIDFDKIVEKTPQL